MQIWETLSETLYNLQKEFFRSNYKAVFSYQSFTTTTELVHEVAFVTLQRKNEALCKASCEELDTEKVKHFRP